MKFIHFVFFSSLLGVFISVAYCEDAKELQESEHLNALEKEFVQTLTDATFNGQWSTLKGGQLSEGKAEKYFIRGVKKVKGDRWLINARIVYGKIDLVVPVPVRVKWAGDTPVIMVSDFGLKGVGTYSARVLVFEGKYAGTWSGLGYGGLLSGAIEKNSE